MEIRTTRLGPLETLTVPDDALLHFPAGLPGFEAHHYFALIEDAYYQPFCWLQALDDPHVKFLVVEPAAFAPDYAPVLDAETLADLDDDATALQVLCILVVPEDVQAMTANLRAPIVLNRRRRRGRQVILHDDRYPVRQPLFATGAAAGERVAAC